MSDLDEMIEKKMERKMMARQHTFFYIVGSAPDKQKRMKSFLLGPYSDYEKACHIAESKRLTSYSIEAYESSDISRVSQILKARKLHSGTPIADIFDRVKHKNVGHEESL